jgi:hypothetical protein
MIYSVWVLMEGKTDTPIESLSLKTANHAEADWYARAMSRSPNIAYTLLCVGNTSYPLFKYINGKAQ